MNHLMYAWLKTSATLMRMGLRLATGRIQTHQDAVLQIPSREPSRTIRAHIYVNKAATASSPSPVLLNFHGSGFILPNHGDDDVYARYIATNTPYTVIDCAYRLAPEYPFPAALHDVEDAVRYVLARPAEYDLSRFAIGGFSAGANFALGLIGGKIFPPKTFRSVVAFYPSTDLVESPTAKIPPDPTGHQLPASLTSLVQQCYLPPYLEGVDRTDPRISPTYADAEGGVFPERMLMVTCARDIYAMEGEKLAQRVKKAQGNEEGVTILRVQGAEHAWDKSCKPGSENEHNRNIAYSLAAQTLLK